MKTAGNSTSGTVCFLNAAGTEVNWANLRGTTAHHRVANNNSAAMAGQLLDSRAKPAVCAILHSSDPKSAPLEAARKFTRDLRSTSLLAPPDVVATAVDGRTAQHGSNALGPMAGEEIADVSRLPEVTGGNKFSFNGSFHPKQRLEVTE